MEEQTLFRRLAVFAGGWTLEAAEAVCGPAGELDVLDALGSLVDKSLVRQDELAGEPRFSMLETIREYALERLQESGEHDDVRDRHADVVAALAEAARSGQAGPEMPTWLRRLDAEQDNVREALGWLLARRDGVRPLVIAGGLYWYWFMRGRVEEGERWTLQALESAPGDATTARAWALTAAGEYPRFRGEHDRALELKEEALALQRELGATNLVAATLYDIGSIHTARGELARARPLLEEALQLRRAAGRELGIAHALGGVAELALREGDYERARGGFEEMLAIADRNDADDFRIVALLSLASVARAEGDVDRAREHLRACVPRVAELEDVFSLPELLDGTAAVVAGVRPETAARLFGAADAVRETTGMMVWEAERVATVREALAAAIGEDSFRARLEEGRALTFAEAAAAALDALDEPRSTRDRTGAGRA